MKKYICTDDAFQYLTVNKVPYNACINAMLAGGIPTVTKADIRQEFAERIKGMFDFCGKNAMGLIDVGIAKGLVDNILAEMESDE